MGGEGMPKTDWMVGKVVQKSDRELFVAASWMQLNWNLRWQKKKNWSKHGAAQLGWR